MAVKLSWLDDPRGHPNRLDNRAARALGAILGAATGLFLAWCVGQACNIPTWWMFGFLYAGRAAADAFAKLPHPPKEPE